MSPRPTGDLPSSPRQESTASLSATPPLLALARPCTLALASGGGRDVPRHSANAGAGVSVEAGTDEAALMTGDDSGHRDAPAAAKAGPSEEPAPFARVMHVRIADGSERVASFLMHRGTVHCAGLFVDEVAASRGHDRVALSLAALAGGGRPETIFPLDSYLAEPLYAALARGSLHRLAARLCRGDPSPAEEARAARLFVRRHSAAAPSSRALPPAALRLASPSVPAPARGAPPSVSVAAGGVFFSPISKRWPGAPAPSAPPPKRQRPPTPTPPPAPLKPEQSAPAGCAGLDALAAVSMIASRLDPGPAGPRAASRPLEAPRGLSGPRCT